MSDKPEGYVFGRPTEYKEQYCKDIIDFFFVEDYTEIVEKRTKSSDGKETIHETALGKKLPTITGFAIKIGVTRQTVLNWASENKDFFNALSRAKEMQEEMLVQNGLRGYYNSGFAKFVAINCTSMEDKVVNVSPKEQTLEAEGFEDTN